MSSRKSIEKPLPYVVENIEEWPIYVTYKNKEEFLNKVKKHVLQHSSWLNKEPDTLRNELKKILYQEKIRLTKTPWKSDDPKEKLFWSGIKKAFP